MDMAERTYGMIKITVEADPMLGHPTEWANVVEIANDCIAAVIERHKIHKAAEKEKSDAPLRS